MKIRNTILVAILLTLSHSLTGCSDNDNAKTEIEESFENLSIENNKVKIVVGTTAEIEILKGNGEYKVSSINQDIATATVENNKIIIEGKTSGETNVILSDKNSLLKNIKVISYYDKIKLDANEEILELEKPLGNTKITNLEILEGNGGYSIENDNTETANVSIKDNFLIINMINPGECNITIKDKFDVIKSLTLKIEETEVAFNDKDKELLKESDVIQYTFGNTTFINENNMGSYYEKYNTVEDGLNLYGWNYYNGYQFLKIYFEGDKSVGVKDNCKIEYKKRESISSDNAKFEIIKNDGSKIWAIFSFIKDNKLYYGNFCQEITTN